ncbi:threonine/serine exporter family protein [Heliobacterium chlorum]|nr:threonine/serine exporter family protein [Heliobacterium chlorum]
MILSIEFLHTIGRIMVANGAEIYRAEECIKYAALALDNICDIHTTVTPNSITISATDVNRQVHTSVRRVTRQGVNLTKIAYANDLSRRLVNLKVSLEEAIEEAIAIERMPGISQFYKIGLLSFNAAMLSLLSDGTMTHFFIAIFVG